MIKLKPSSTRKLDVDKIAKALGAEYVSTVEEMGGIHGIIDHLQSRAAASPIPLPELSKAHAKAAKDAWDKFEQHVHGLNVRCHEEQICLIDAFFNREAEKPEHLRKNYCHISCPCRKCKPATL